MLKLDLVPTESRPGMREGYGGPSNGELMGGRDDHSWPQWTPE